MKCAECKFWDRTSKYSNEVENGLGECIKAKPYWQCTDWGEKPDYERHLKEEFKDLKMFVQDMSDCSAHLWTRENFYCAHFEKLK